MGRINPWLEQKLEEIEASSLRYIVETVPNLRLEVKRELQAIPDVEVIAQPADRFIVVEALPELVHRMAEIPGVEVVSAETLIWIKFLPTPPEILRIDSPVKFDPYLNQVRLSPVEIPVSPGGAVAKLPFRMMELNDIIVYTTEVQGKYMEVPGDNRIETKVAAADTGYTVPHILAPLPPAVVDLQSVIPFEPIPFDGQGHGQWVGTCLSGEERIHPRWGRCKGITSPREQLHIKCLSNLGFGATSWVLASIYRAWEWGAKVLNMSLGGPLQGSVKDDPLCRLIRAFREDLIVVVAAGNDGIDWSIGSPGAAPDALTIGSWSMKDNGLAWFSSRGPSGGFYEQNPDVWERDLAQVGEDLVKPDCCAPGGGRVNREDRDEQILSGCSGWYDPYGDPLPGFGTMKGTSMASPAAAGLVALAYDKGLIKSAKDVKIKLARYNRKNPETGYGLVTWNKLT